MLMSQLYEEMEHYQKRAEELEKDIARIDNIMENLKQNRIEWNKKLDDLMQRIDDIKFDIEEESYND